RRAVRQLRGLERRATRARDRSAMMSDSRVHLQELPEWPHDRPPWTVRRDLRECGLTPQGLGDAVFLQRHESGHVLGEAADIVGRSFLQEPVAQRIVEDEKLVDADPSAISRVMALAASAAPRKCVAHPLLAR